MTPSLQCAGPRCYHTSAPKQSAENASGHDDGMWKALEGLFGRQTGHRPNGGGTLVDKFALMRLGGHGLRKERWVSGNVVDNHAFSALE